MCQKAQSRRRPYIRSKSQKETSPVPSSTKHRYKLVVKRGRWTSDEDALLSSTVAVHGTSNWHNIARFMQTERLPKQCRERWAHTLDPELNHEPFTSAEDQKVLDAYHEHGTKWAEIARMLTGRTAGAVKNRIVSLTTPRVAPKPKSPRKPEMPRKPVGRPRKHALEFPVAKRVRLAPIKYDELLCDETVVQLLQASPAHALKDPALLPKRAETTVMKRVVVISSPTGCRRAIGLGNSSPFKAINAMMRRQYNASNDAWDGMPLYYQPIA